MKRLAAFSFLIIFAVTGCAHPRSDSGWTTLIEGDKGLDNFDRVGDVNWRPEGGAIVGDKGKGGHLVSKNAYTDFELYAEFWADHTTNSGIFVRARDAKKISSRSAYEVNISDRGPRPEYSTGAIVGFAVVPVPPIHLAGGKWNTMEIYAKGAEITVKVNGQVTVHMTNSDFATGPLTLQFGNGPKGAPGGAIKWRIARIRSL